MADFQPPPTYAEPVLVNPETQKATFNPIWLNWFLAFAALLEDSAALAEDAIIGPALATANAVVLFDGTTGKLAKDSLTLVDTDGALAANSDLKLATQKATKTYADTKASAANKLSFFAATTSAELAGVISDETGSGGLVFATSPTLVTPVLGVATGTSLAATGKLTSSGTAGVGYATGAGGTIAQATSKSTGVTLDKISGQITMDGAGLAAGIKVSFVVSNNTVAATDIPVVCVVSGGTVDAYRAEVTAVGVGSFDVTVENITLGLLSEQPVIGFAIIKAVAA